MIIVTYMFEGGDVPPAFYEAIYKDPDTNSLKILKSENWSWGDDHAVTVSSEDHVDLETRLREWEGNKV